MSESLPTLAALQDQPIIELPELVAAVSGMAYKIPEFANRVVPGIKLPFGWLEHGGGEVDLTLLVVHEDPAQLPQPGIYARASITVEDTITDWPSEVKEEAKLTEDYLAEVEDGFVITRHHAMEVGFAAGYLTWSERFEYVLHNPELERIIDASDMTIDAEGPHDPGVAELNIDSEEAALFAAICGDFVAAARATRDQHRMRQALAVMESVRLRQPFSTQAFFENPATTAEG